jgi:hypothetical protein
LLLKSELRIKSLLFVVAKRNLCTFVVAKLALPFFFRVSSEVRIGICFVGQGFSLAMQT